MKGGGGILLIVVGILLLFIAVTGRFLCLADFLKCVVGGPLFCRDQRAGTTPNGNTGVAGKITDILGGFLPNGGTIQLPGAAKCPPFFEYRDGACKPKISIPELPDFGGLGGTTFIKNRGR